MPDQPAFHLAQVNIARARFPIDDPGMADFMNQLDEINALADTAPGFVWRLKDESGNATDFQPYDDPRILINLSVWNSVEQLHDFVYKTAHAEVMRRRYDWFEKPNTHHVALWWTPADEHPSTLDATARLLHLSQYGPTASAFTFKQRFPAPAARI
ncbi:MAG: DUF3291 domain-containing protein [Alphaproteobacteria bacterium]|nr:DUF3291 domain-containing protein [Alphaproteobacteria bacterium]